MKITEAQAIPIRIPLKKPFTIALGTLTHTNHVFVRMKDDEGRTGWGETTTFHSVYGYDQKSLYHVLTDHLLPAIEGFNPADTVKLHERLELAIPFNWMAKTAVDLASTVPRRSPRRARQRLFPAMWEAASKRLRD